MSVPVDRDETGRSKQPYALNRARGTHRAGGTAGATTRRDGSRGTSAIARLDRDPASRASRGGAPSWPCVRVSASDRLSGGTRGGEPSGRFRGTGDARASLRGGSDARRSRASRRLWGGNLTLRTRVAICAWGRRARRRHARERGGSRRLTGEERVHRRGTLFRDWMPYACVIFGGGAPPAGEHFFSHQRGAGAGAPCRLSRGVSCVFRGPSARFAAHSTRARIFANAPRRLDRGPREADFDPPAHPPGRQARTDTMRPPAGGGRGFGGGGRGFGGGRSPGGRGGFGGRGGRGGRGGFDDGPPDTVVGA